MTMKTKWKNWIRMYQKTWQECWKNHRGQDQSWEKLWTAWKAGHSWIFWHLLVEGGGVGKVFPPSANFLLFTQNCANFCNFSWICTNFCNFPQNFGKFWQFLLKKGGKLFQNFSASGEKMKFFVRIFTYESGSRLRKLNFSSPAC